MPRRSSRRRHRVPVPSPDVPRFREELLARSDLKDELEPPEFDPEDSPDDALKYDLLTLSVRQLSHLPEVLPLANT
jgi:hypothetical protein